MFFKRLSRSRSNSQSYVDNYSPHDSKANSQDYGYAGDKYSSSAPVSASAEQQQFPIDDRRDLPSSRHSNTAPQLSDPLAKETGGVSAPMYPRQSQPTEVQRNDGMYNSPPPLTSARGLSNGNGYGNEGGYDSMPQQKSTAAPPDLLMQAFNQALRPHMDKVDSMESEIKDLRAYIDQLEQQQSEVHAWIDKRGLRPGKTSPLHTPHSSQTNVSQTSHQA